MLFKSILARSKIVTLLDLPAKESFHIVANEIGEVRSSGVFIRQFVCEITFLFYKQNGVCEKSYQRGRADRSGGGKICCPVSGASIGVLAAVCGKMCLGDLH